MATRLSERVRLCGLSLAYFATFARFPLKQPARESQPDPFLKDKAVKR